MIAARLRRSSRSRCSRRYRSFQRHRGRSGLPGRGLVRTVRPEPGADLTGVGVVQVVEDGYGILPGPTGCLGLPGRVLGIAEVGKDSCLGVAVAEFPEQAERTLVTRRGRSMIAGLVLGFAEAVPGLRLIGAMAEFLQAEHPGLLVAAEVGVAPADGGQSPGLLHLVTDGLEQVQGPLAVAERLGVAVLEVGYPGRRHVDEGLPDPVTEPTVQLEAVRQVSTCQVVPGKLRVRPGQDAVGGGLAADIAGARRPSSALRATAASSCQCPLASR
jgi:hypothetical protein